jgi:hypothetical protein
VQPKKILIAACVATQLARNQWCLSRCELAKPTNKRFIKRYYSPKIITLIFFSTRNDPKICFSLQRLKKDGQRHGFVAEDFALHLVSNYLTNKHGDRMHMASSFGMVLLDITINQSLMESSGAQLDISMFGSPIYSFTIPHALLE